MASLDDSYRNGFNNESIFQYKKGDRTGSLLVCLTCRKCQRAIARTSLKGCVPNAPYILSSTVITLTNYDKTVNFISYGRQIVR